MAEIDGTKLVSAEIEGLDRRLGLRLPRSLRRSRRSSACGRAELLAEQVAQRRALLRAMPLASKQEWEQAMESLMERQALSCWEVIMFASLRPDVNGGPDFQRWQIATKLIRSPELTTAELLSAAVEFARQGRLVAAIYALSRSISEMQPKRFEAVCAVCLVMAAINDDLLRRKATVDAESCRSYVQVQQACVDLLRQLLRNSAVDQDLLADQLERLQTLLGQQGAHGHALALKWMERQLKLVPGDGWLVEVGCSREIIEGQHSTAQLASFARQMGGSLRASIWIRRTLRPCGVSLAIRGATGFSAKGRTCLPTGALRSPGSTWMPMISGTEAIPTFERWSIAGLMELKSTMRTAFCSAAVCLLSMTPGWRRGSGLARVPWRCRGCWSWAGRWWRRRTEPSFSSSHHLMEYAVK